MTATANEPATRRESAWWRWIGLSLLVVALAVTLSQPIGLIESDSIVYTEAAESIAQGSYAAASEPGGVPRYPPGLPLLLAPLTYVAWPDSASALMMAIGAALCGLVWFSARVLGGWRAASVAAVVWSFSPMLRTTGQFIMSDAPAALLVMAALLAVIRGRWILAGLAIGGSSVIRLPHVLFTLASWRRSYLVSAAAVLIPLALFQLATYGRLAGYSGSQAQFAPHYLWGDTLYLQITNPSSLPNWQFFPGTLLGMDGHLVPLLPLAASAELWRRRDSVARFALAIVSINLGTYLFYFYQMERFLLPAACVLTVFAAVWLGERLPAAAPPTAPLDEPAVSVSAEPRAGREAAGSMPPLRTGTLGRGTRAEGLAPPSG